MMGTGQIYVHEYSKGSLFIAADLVDKGAFIGLIAYINNKYSPKDDEIINVGWKDLESGDKALIISYFVAKFGLKFFSVYDAVKSTQKYNERLFDRNENRGVSLTFNQKALNLEYTVQFSD
jgi:hypothetical protein